MLFFNLKLGLDESESKCPLKIGYTELCFMFFFHWFSLLRLHSIHLRLQLRPSCHHHPTYFLCLALPPTPPPPRTPVSTLVSTVLTTLGSQMVTLRLQIWKKGTCVIFGDLMILMVVFGGDFDDDGAKVMTITSLRERIFFFYKKKFNNFCDHF